MEEIVFSIKNMRQSSLGGYDAYIVDLDGTLYSQPPVRFGMAKKLMVYYGLHFWKLKELFAIYKYRKLREKDMFAGQDDFEHLEYEYLAAKLHMDEARLINTIKVWMIDTPLALINKNRNSKLIEFLESRIQAGAKVIVYSDYPVEDKLGALKFSPTASYYSGDATIACLKPNPQGLKNILSENGLAPEKTLFIGDRMEKDGECAKACGVDYGIL